MQALIASATLVFAAAITPGPNNFLVLRIALENGVRAALPAIAGVVLGGLAMLALAQLRDRASNFAFRPQRTNECAGRCRLSVHQSEVVDSGADGRRRHPVSG